MSIRVPLRGAPSSFLLLLLLLPCLPPATSDGLWRRVSLSLSRLYRSTRQETFSLPQTLMMNPFLICVPRCGKEAWCRVWCVTPDSTTCIFSNAVLVDGYAEVNMTDAISCYTRRKRDLALGAIISGTPEYAAGRRSKSNLVDGFYPNILEECYVSTRVVNPFVLIDLGAPKTIRHVFLIFEDSLKAVHQENYELRMGITPVSDVTTYPLVAVFRGPATAGEEVVIEMANPVTARYVSIQMKKDFWYVFCHIEIA